MNFLHQIEARPEVGVFLGLLVLTMIVLVLLCLLLQRIHREAENARGLNEALISALQDAFSDNERRSSDVLAREMNTLRSEFLSTVDGLKDAQHAGALAAAERFTRAEEARGVRDREMLQVMTQHLTLLRGEQAGLKNEMDRQLAAVREANERATRTLQTSVEEKLQASLSERLSSSFRTVESQLAAVHRGLGEMREMAQNVDGLRRVLTNVKTRGTFGEVQLAMILEDLLTPAQYATNVATRPKSSERVEFAVKLPGREAGRTVYLPIDSKFPMEDYERLIAASDAADAEGVKSSLKGLENRLVLEARKIHDKYIESPHTTEFAVLYLPMESLWAEVLKIPGLLERLQREFHVTVAGPTVLAALLNSLQMGFKTLAIEEKSAEVWRLLAAVKMEFGRFTEAVDKMEKRLANVSGDLSQLRTRTNAMNQCLRDLNPQVVERSAEADVRVDAQRKD